MKLDQSPTGYFLVYEPGDRVVLPISPALRSPRVELLIGTVTVGNTGPGGEVTVAWPADRVAPSSTSRARVSWLAPVPTTHRRARWRSDLPLPTPHP